MYTKQTIFPAILAILALFAIIIAPAAATTQLVALQGRVLQSGSPATSGSLAVTIWSNGPDSGSVLYSDNFANAINDGFFDVMLGASSELNLTFGNFYHLDMSINGQDINWTSPTGTTINRIKFQSRNGGASMNLTDTSSATILYVDSANSRVGIGTTSPMSKLEVSGGAVNISASNDNAKLELGDTGAANSQRYHWQALATGYLRLNSIKSTGDVVDIIVVNGTSGNVGIGANSPAATLDVTGGIRLTGGNSTCGVNNRGELRYAAGATNADDTLYWCAKNSTNIYNWALISRGG